MNLVHILKFYYSVVTSSTRLCVQNDSTPIMSLSNTILARAKWILWRLISLDRRIHDSQLVKAGLLIKKALIHSKVGLKKKEKKLIPLICLASWDCNFHNKKYYDNYGTLEVGNPAHIFVFYKLYFCYVAIPLKDLVTFAWRNNPVSNFNTALMLSCGVPFFFSFFRKYHSMHNCTTLPYIKTPWEWGLYGPISPSFELLAWQNTNHEWLCGLS